MQSSNALKNHTVFKQAAKMLLMIDRALILTIISIISMNCFGRTSSEEEVLGCGGFLKSNFTINYSRVEVKLYTKQGSLKYQTDCAPNNGYYLIPLYDKGHFTLKVEPPVGWKFHPSSVSLHVDGVTDLCSQNKDINFQFLGFTVHGKVVSKNSPIGPSGVKVLLKNSLGEIVQVSESKSDGVYSFSSVLPGDYIIFGNHDRWLFHQNGAKISVIEDNVKTKDNIIVAGYDVQGYVFSEGEPIQGVHFLLFSERKFETVPLGCNKEEIRRFLHKHDGNFLCFSTSTSDGSFHFPCLEPGSYTLVPFYEGELIEFDVSPSKVQFKVKEESFTFGESFQVQGFGVSGYVLAGKDRTAIGKAEIFVNGKLQTVTDAKGIYHLESMRTGTYEITVKAANFLFESVIRKITPNTPYLPDIFPSKLFVCGLINVLKHPIGHKNEKMVMSLKSFDGKAFDKVHASDNGSFCFAVYPGKYTIKPFLSEEERANELKFIPAQKVVNVDSNPILDIIFTQFLARVQGQVLCIGDCMSLLLKIKPLQSNENNYHIETKTTSEGKFQVSGFLPGNYLLNIEKDSWCFESKSRKFEIIDRDVLNLNLKQSGFQAIIIISHASSFKVKYPSEQIHSLALKNGRNVLCLPEEGIYHFMPVGCHLYSLESFKFDTNNPEERHLNAVKHLFTGAVLTEVNVSDIEVVINDGSTFENIILEKPEERKEEFFKYIFSVFVDPDSELKITVSSAKLLFYPSVTHVKMLNDCINGTVEIIGRKGLFITGSVTPALANVKVQVIEKKSKKNIAEVLTNNEGIYRVGPLNSKSTYSVTAMKQGYHFTLQESSTNFTAFKLAEIIIEVNSVEGLPLSGVLLSLSGGKDYRKNSLTKLNGEVTFSGLSPGQYFIRPVLKEFQFQPPTKIIDVIEGMATKVMISGKRVAYSIFGTIGSITGESEVGIVMEAIGIGEKCHQQQEESVSEQGGVFRIRGLLPNCQYSVHLKNESDVNQHIMQATPDEVLVKIVDDDIKEIHIIVFRHFGQADISGSVVVNQEYLSTLKVMLYNADNPDMVLHSIGLNRGGFFFLPSIPLDKKDYMIRLDSSLSSSSYQYEEPSVILTANKSFHHVTFVFEPHRKSVDQEIAQASILALPLAILVFLLMYNRIAVLKIASDVSQVFSSFVGSYQTASSTDYTATDNVNVKRKIKPKRL